MIIQCPACHARARIPDTQEGAKVRCGECGRVFVAGATGRGRSSSSSNSGLWIGLGVGGVAILAVLIIAFGGGDSKPKRPKVEEPEEVAVAPPEQFGTGYESKEVQAAVKVHQYAFTGEAARIRSAMHGPGIYASKKGREAAAEVEGDETVEITDVQRAVWEAEFVAMTTGEKQALLNEWSEGMVSGPDKALVADWKPYDGSFQGGLDELATVHVNVTSREEGNFENRTVEWKLHKDRGTWKICGWERFLSDREKWAMSSRANRGYEKVTLSDGSKVFEREPEPLPHLDDTSPELAARIDGLIATMIDLDLTREATRARNEVIEIGRPAIPPLLTKLYLIPLDTEEQSIQVNQVVVALRTITGQDHGYRPREFIGAATGTTRERRESAIKQWFAWWWRNKKKFTSFEQEDALEDLIELTDEEKAWLERHKDD